MERVLVSRALSGLSRDALKHFATSIKSDTAGKFGRPYAADVMSATKADWRVLALGTPASQAPIRSRFTATAVRMWPRWVLARPMYRVRRSRQARTPCEMVPSMPARLRYNVAKDGVRSRCRAARSAWY